MSEKVGLESFASLVRSAMPVGDRRSYGPTARRWGFRAVPYNRGMRIDLNCDMGESLASTAAAVAPGTTVSASSRNNANIRSAVIRVTPLRCSSFAQVESRTFFAASGVGAFPKIGNYDLGSECDEEILEVVTSANVACGFHAGDPVIMDRTVGLAMERGVAIGASHPGHHELPLRGLRLGARSRPRRTKSRRTSSTRWAPSPPSCVSTSTERDDGPREAARSPLQPGGGRPEASSAERALARAVARADKGLVFVGLATSSAMREAAEAEGLRFAGEAFADRVYNPDGTLQSRRIPGSVIHDPEKAAAQAVAIAHGSVIAHDGTEVPVSAETLCLHGDNPAALENARTVRRRLEAAGVAVRGLV